MKRKILQLLAGISIFLTSFLSQADTLSYSATENVLSTGTTFTFSQFNSALGTISAIDLIINSSSPDGSITVTNTGVTAMDVEDIEARFRLNANATLGLTLYTTSYLSLTTTPSVPVTLGPSGSQAFSISGGQSFIGGSPVTRSIGSGAFAQYYGSGTVAFTSTTQTNISATGADYNISSASFFSPTNLTLRYTYTPSGPVPVPEPGQVAASLLLLGGIGAYVFLKRRKKTATTAA